MRYLDKEIVIGDMAMREQEKIAVDVKIAYMNVCKTKSKLYFISEIRNCCVK